MIGALKGKLYKQLDRNWSDFIAIISDQHWPLASVLPDDTSQPCHRPPIHNEAEWLRWEGCHELEANLGYKVRPGLMKKKQINK